MEHEKAPKESKETPETTVEGRRFSAASGGIRDDGLQPQNGESDTARLAGILTFFGSIKVLAHP